jgi:hypothetical protein
MTKKNKIEGANLTDKQKQEIKKQILQQYPQLVVVQQELDFLIEQSIYISKQLGGTVLGQNQVRLAPAGRQHPLVMIS